VDPGGGDTDSARGKRAGGGRGQLGKILRAKKMLSRKQIFRWEKYAAKNIIWLLKNQ